MTKFKKTTLAALSVTMAATLAASQIIAYANDFRGSTFVAESVQEISANNLTGSLDLSNIALSQLSDKVIDNGEEVETKEITGSANTVKTVIVSFDTPSLVEAKGDDMDVAEYLSTSDGRMALKNIEDAQNSFLRKLASSGVSYREVDRYSTVMSGVAIEVNTAQFSKIKKFANVDMVGVSKTYAALETTDAQINPSNVYGTGIYNSSEIMEKYGVDGSGISVAVLDTGLDYTHPAFSHDPEEVSFGRDKVAEVFDKLRAHERASSVTVDDLYLSKKVPFAFDYADDDADVYPSYSQHGVHVSGIIAGKDDYYINKDGEQVGEKDDVFDFLGGAPEAQIVVCKVFTDDLNSDDLGGATSEDIIAALDDCVTLGVDIINMSLGTACGFSNISIDGDEEGKQLLKCYTSIKDAGISLITAAGNEYSSGSGSEFGTNLASNPDSGTVGSPSTFVGAMSVASINGLPSPYMIANEGEGGEYGSVPIYYNDSNDANAVPFDFAEEMLGDKDSETFTYLVIPGIGNAGDYSASVKKRLLPESEGGLKKDGEKIIVVVRRGTSDFKTKVEIAHSMHADGIIVYNNVPGTIRMSLSDIEERDRIPSVSINMDAGAKLTTNPNDPTRLRAEGKIKIDKNLQAGPFMNDYSSWGATPDLKLKPDITSHGGEITSTVAGGYEEMSGTSMATPNLAGLMALVRSYYRTHSSDLFGEDLTAKNSANNVKLTRLLNQIVMSTATLVYDEEKLPYSPRKQGAGLATLDNIFSTKAYLYTPDKSDANPYVAEDNRPKIELGEDEAKKGEYSFSFKVKNFGKDSLTFGLISRFMTETISSDGLAVAEAAYMLDDIAAQFTVEGATASGDKYTLAADSEATINVTLKLSNEEKAYLDRYFKNGMYVEGFISLDFDGEQCDLNLPFMGFYGDWESAPMLDYNAYEISEIEQDTSMTDDEKPHESVFATQLYSTYYNGKYAVPMGSFAYVQDEFADQVYVTEEHCAISRFNIFNGPTDNSNYLTSTGVRALYAGLLRNAELVTYDLYNADTGELVYHGTKYRIGKAYAGGGSARPALVDLRDDKIDTDNLPLYDNGKYEIEFNFYMKADDVGKPVKYDNNFSSTFYVDFDAPILQGSRIRYYDYKENNKTKQRVYLDLDVYDNHYPQSVLLCYSDETYDPNSPEPAEINLATEYVTPIYNPTRNSTNTVSIEITDIYEKYKDYLYVQIDDYALNHSVYSLSFDTSNKQNANADFKFVENDRVVGNTQFGGGDTTYSLILEKNELYKVELNCGSANLSNYEWATNSDVIKVKNGEVFGVKPGTAKLYVNGPGPTGSKSLILDITVVDSNRTLPVPSLKFGVIKGDNDNLVVAQGTVRVNAGQTFDFEVNSDPWYYPVEELNLVWSSSNTDIATVEQNGQVKTLNTHGTSVIRATVYSNERPTNTVATVTLNVAEPFTISNMTLSKYHGSEVEVHIPDDENVMYIGEEAFKDNETMQYLYIPKTVTQIDERAFLNCTALKEVYFIAKTDEPVKDLAAISLILADAFQGCTALEKVDLTNVKVVTIADRTFAGCSKLKEIVHMEKIGIAGNYAFAGCTSLKNADITGLHTAGVGVFSSYGNEIPACTGLETIKTDHYTAISAGMFQGCTKLDKVVINNPRVSSRAFQGCTSLTSVTFGGDGVWNNTVFRIEPYAFAGCTDLATVTFNESCTVSYIGDYAFAQTKITNFTMPKGMPTLGESIFDGTENVNISWGEGYSEDGIQKAAGSQNAIYRDTVLVRAPATIDSSFSIDEETTEIGPYAFTDSTFDNVNTIAIPQSVKVLGEGAFAGTAITTIEIPSGITVLPASAFRQSKLTTINIPATVKSIGERAFAFCPSLTSVTFEGPSQLEFIGTGAFSECGIEHIKLPDGVKTMGDLVFSQCESLTNAELPSVEKLGGYTFENCPNLKDVKFGANAKDSGIYTFYPGFDRYQQLETGGMVAVHKTNKLDTVDLGGLKEIKEGVFYACTNLENINLKNVTAIGLCAFAECSKLATVTNLDKVKDIGDIAFAATSADNSKITSLNLAAAEHIGAQAFLNSAATTLTLSSVKSIGTQAFAGIQISTLQLPASLETYGAGAFLAATKLNNVTVQDGNPNFFAKGNVLYRNITDARTQDVSYELCLYPSGRTGSTYEVIDGTSAIQAYSFAYLSGNLSTVDLPYSVKTIGAYAFTGDYIQRYNFKSINAPRLLAEYYDNGLGSSAFHSMYYTNFNQSILAYSPDMVEGAGTSTVTMGCPDNGIGYDNFIYSRYFGNKVSLGELMDDLTRALIKLIDSFNLENVQGWLSLEVNDANKEIINAFAQSVKEAHRMYLDIASEKQLNTFLNGNGSNNRVEKLLNIETALKPVKVRFGIAPKVSSLRVAASSNYKTEYVEGETFDMTGLAIEVVFDDYSSEILTDLSNVKIGALYSGELHTYNNFVTVEYMGCTLRLPITVTAKDENSNPNAEQGQNCSCGNCSGCGTMDIGTTIGGMGILLLTLTGVILLVQRYRRKANKTEGSK